MTETVVIERRFRGPPESANGGYTCRKLFAGTAILDPEGEPLAVSEATWIELREPRAGA
ncbi:MAG: hypothetical protein ACRDKH_02225 [Solirubrobacterales bacterium]